MPCELFAHFKNLLKQVPQGPAGYPHIEFLNETFPALPAVVVSDDFVLRIGGHNYNGAQTARIILFASRRAFRLLGLLLLAQSFASARAVVTLEFSDKRSHIKRLVVRSSCLEPRPTGLSVVPVRYVYFPSGVQRDPDWASYDLSRYPFPSWYLSNQDATWDSYMAMKSKTDDRDSLHEASCLESRVNLAEYFLNFGRSHSRQHEFRMEGPCGRQAVGPSSVEIEGWLPQTFGWNPDGC